MRSNCVFPPSVAMGSFSAASGSIRDASFPRNAKASPACLPPPSPPPLPPPPPGAVAAAAAARASSNSRWTRLSVIETVRLSSPPPLHFQLRKNSYSRKRAIGQPACPIASYLPTNRGAQTPDARSTPRLSVFYLDVAIVTACGFLFWFLFCFGFFWSFFLFAAGPLPLLAERSLAGAHFVCSLSDSSRSDL